MSHPVALDHMLAAWNERDPSKVRAHLEAALAPDVHFVDPSIDLHGIDEFEQNVHEVQGRIPGADYLRASAVDTHHDWYRYHWEIRLDGKRLIQGFDTTEIDADGKVATVIGFFGDLPLD